MNLNLLIFALVSLIILFPIIYFLPLKISSRGKIVVIAVSFCISLIGLFTKFLFQVWQSVLLLVALILLVTIIFKKRFTPFMFSMADKHSIAMDDAEPLKKDHEADLFTFDYIPELTPQQHLEAEKQLDTVPVLEPLPAVQADFQLNEAAAAVEPISQLEEIDPAVIAAIHEDLSLKPAVEPAAEKEVVLTAEQMDTEFLDVADLSAFIEKEQHELTLSKEESEVNENLTYLAELEEMMMGTQPEANVEPLSVQDSEDKIEPSLYSDALEELLKEVELEDHSLIIDDTETAVTLEDLDVKDVTESIDEGTVEPILVEEPLDALEESMLQDNDMEIGEQANVIQDIVIETSDKERINTFIDRTDTMNENNDDAEEENYIQYQPELEDNQTEDFDGKHKEVFQTILLQAEIAKKILDQSQYEKFLQGYLNYERPAVESYTFASLLIEHYLNSHNYHELLSLLGKLEENFSQYPILLQEIHYLQAHYAEK